MLAAVLMTGVTVLAGSGLSQVNAAPLQAGINAVITECLEGTTEKVTIEKTEKDQVKASEGEEEKTIFGYTNLGIANVDDYLNVRESADENSEKVGRMDDQTACEILKEKGDWYKIKSGDVKGFVKKKYILTGKKAKKAAKEQVKTIVTVNTKTLYVRKRPNRKCAILKSVSSGDKLEVKKTDSGWVKVKLEDGSGYVCAKYVKVGKELETAKSMEQIRAEKASANGVTVSDGNAGQAAAQLALQYVGYPYVWGGTSLTNGVDCSGFTMQIMAKFGVYLPHFAASQAAYGTSVSTSELQAGDLIFYGNGITHVAIYIGGGQIVHASNSRDGIKVSNAFYSTPVCCRRVL